MAEAFLPYCGVAPVPSELMMRWNFDGVLLSAMTICLLIGWRFRREGGGAPLIGAFSLLFLLWISPLCALSSALFSIRALHHVAMTAIAAPLIALAFRGGKGERLALWTAICAAVFWGWHLPAAYDSALSSDIAYWLMQVTLLGSAVAFWRAVIASPLPSAIAALLTTMVQMGLLGGLLTFAGTALYAPHWFTTGAWGLSPVEDQQLGGLIMWVPGAGLYLAAALVMANRWLTAPRPAAA